jgi:sigma-B regulation protein RsbU (phosphoserine phosphatase)
MESLKRNRHFVEDIVDGMLDWVRVIDRDNNVIYMNKAMSDGLGGPQTGLKCYQILGRSEPCINCISREAVFDNKPHEKEENIGDRIFSVMSSPLKNDAGEIIAVVEVLRDTTQVRQLQKELIRQNMKLNDELKLAKKLQCSLLPKQLPEDKIDFSFIYKPCDELGGDFLDIFKIDERHVGIYIADVSGHGVPASMLTVFLRSTLNKKLLSPARALQELYQEFNASSLDENLYITIFYAVIDLEDMTMKYSNAGHNVCPVIFNSSGRFDLLRLPGIPISNWLEKPEYRDGDAELYKGDRVFFYTDGIIEMRNPANEQFGEERILDLLLNGKLEPVSTLNAIVDAACSFAGITDIAGIPDDITIALLEIK